MADMQSSMQGSNGIAFLVSAGIVYEIIAAACSSPQTAEINAHSRAGTLMKWVYVGVGMSAVFVAAAAYMDKKHRGAIVAGGATAAIAMLAAYKYALSAGLHSSAPGTEG